METKKIQVRYVVKWVFVKYIHHAYRLSGLLDAWQFLRELSNYNTVLVGEAEVFIKLHAEL